MALTKKMTVKTTGSTTLSPSAATTSTPFTVAVPQNGIGIPVRIRVVSNVNGTITLVATNGSQYTIGLNPNVPETGMAVPKGVYPLGVNSVSLNYTSAGAGNIVVMVDFA